MYAVDVRSANGIQYIVQFAAKHNLRLVVRNTGHDFTGRITASGTFSIWTHHLNGIEVVEIPNRQVL